MHEIYKAKLPLNFVKYHKELLLATFGNEETERNSNEVGCHKHAIENPSTIPLTCLLHILDMQVVVPTCLSLSRLNRY
jgi:hypothetical protein